MSESTDPWGGVPADPAAADTIRQAVMGDATHPLHAAYWNNGHALHQKAVERVTALAGVAFGQPVEAAPTPAQDSPEAIVVPGPASLAVPPAERGAVEAGILDAVGHARAAGAIVTNADLEFLASGTARYREMSDDQRGGYLADQGSALRSAWGEAYDTNIATVTEWLDRTGLRAIADEAGATSDAVKMAQLLQMAKRGRAA